VGAVMHGNRISDREDHFEAKNPLRSLKASFNPDSPTEPKRLRKPMP
jgi:hypothetical protein